MRLQSAKSFTQRRQARKRYMFNPLATQGRDCQNVSVAGRRRGGVRSRRRARAERGGSSKSRTHRRREKEVLPQNREAGWFLRGLYYPMNQSKQTNTRKKTEYYICVGTTCNKTRSRHQKMNFWPTNWILRQVLRIL